MLMQQETMITSSMIDKVYVVNYFTLPNLTRLYNTDDLPWHDSGLI